MDSNVIAITTIIILNAIGTYQAFTSTLLNVILDLSVFSLLAIPFAILAILFIGRNNRSKNAFRLMQEVYGFQFQEQTDTAVKTHIETILTKTSRIPIRGIKGIDCKTYQSGAYSLIDFSYQIKYLPLRSRKGNFYTEFILRFPCQTNLPATFSILKRKEKDVDSCHKRYQESQQSTIVVTGHKDFDSRYLLYLDPAVTTDPYIQFALELYPRLEQHPIDEKEHKLFLVFYYHIIFDTGYCYIQFNRYVSDIIPFYNLAVSLKR